MVSMIYLIPSNGYYYQKFILNNMLNAIKELILINAKGY